MSIKLGETWCEIGFREFNAVKECASGDCDHIIPDIGVGFHYCQYCDGFGPVALPENWRNLPRYRRIGE